MIGTAEELRAFVAGDPAVRTAILNPDGDIGGSQTALEFLRRTAKSPVPPESQEPQT